MFRTPEPNLLLKEKLKIFGIVHWRGLVCLFVPILCIGVLLPFPPKNHQWAAYIYLVMIGFWVTECIPLPVTSFLPLLVPISGIMSTKVVCDNFVYNDIIFTFIGSHILVASVQQSGLHKRIAFLAIKSLGYSHEKLLVAMVVVTTFVSMWIPNIAATTMMVPIIFAILKVFEDQNLLKIYDVTESGEKIASDITTCYFCTAAYSATIGGIGTHMGSIGSMILQVLFNIYFRNAPDYLSVSKLFAFGIPYMILLDIFMVLYILVIYVGFLRPNSAAAKRAKIPPEGLVAAEATLSREYKALGPLTFWEFMVILLFGGAMVSFFCRSPQIFVGWAEHISNYFEKYNSEKYDREIFIGNTPVAALFITMMLLFPSNLSFCKNLKAKFYEDLPKKRIPSVLNWKNTMAELSFSYIFILGGAFSVVTAAQRSGLIRKIHKSLQALAPLPNIVVLLVFIIVFVLMTNVAPAITVANAFIPNLFQLAKVVGRNPLWYGLACGFSASFGFLLPVATPGNLIVHGVAKIPTVKMIKAGLGPTITSIIITWLAICFYAPIIWPDLHTDKPTWAN